MSDNPHPPRPATSPGVASAEAGLVVLDGPDGLAITMTADAAMQTGESLIAAARQARMQGEESQR